MSELPRILVVDDEKTNRETFTALIEQAIGGYEAVTVDGGEAALARIGPDIALVLMDVIMPAADGFDVVRQIRQMPEVADVPICMVTALNSSKERLEAIEAGADAFISKPVDKRYLQAVITHLLDGPRARTIARLRETCAALENENRRLREQLIKALSAAP